MYALTIFLSAFLLFQVQPLVGKYILPWFGGSPAVWTTCVLFFQVVLLGGYAYAYLVASHLRPRAQAVLHTVLLAAALAVLPITPDEGWKPPDPSRPELRILLLLAASVGLPYLVLSTTSPLLQAWYARARPGHSVYRLYALSNVGSLLALLSYPFVVEPALSRTTQARVWSGLFVAFAILCAAGAWRAARAGPGAADAAAAPSTDDAAPAGADEPVSGYRRAMWITLPAVASVLLLGGTNTLCQDVAAVPFLWVVPLALYLLTFIMAFDHPRWYRRGVFGPLLAVALVTALAVSTQGAYWAPLKWQIVVYSAIIFVGCMFCHGELARMRPHGSPRSLTAYYLSIAAGGAIGGVFVVVVAPRVFHVHREFALSLWAAAALGLVVAFNDARSRMYRGRPAWAWVTLIAGCLLAGYVAASAGDAGAPGREVLYRTRNFYGVLSVIEYDQAGQAGNRVRSLRHGRILHGLQFLNPLDAGRAVSYYSPASGFGRTVAALNSRADAGEPRRMGVVGLGTGTAAMFARPGDTVRFYEIDPDVLRIAREYFTYLDDSAARPVEVVLGDGRLALEREPQRDYDVLLLDAFSGDAVPVHLLTRECFELYLRHLSPDGVILMNISNHHLDLRPVAARVAEHFGLRGGVMYHGMARDEDPSGVYSSTWVILTRDPGLFDSPALSGDVEPLEVEPDVRTWTDDDANLFKVLK